MDTPSPRATHHIALNHNNPNPNNPNNPNPNNPNPYPTTFVQADTSSFKQVVQMLTGSPNPNPNHSPNPNPNNPNPIPLIKTPSKSKPSRLYERRNSLKNNLRITRPGLGFGSSPRHTNSDLLSPSLLDFPALTLSPVTPLIPDPFNRSPAYPVDSAAEERAIAEKGYFLHPSPVTTPRDSEPRLLPLFPEISPRMQSSDRSRVVNRNG